MVEVQAFIDQVHLIKQTGINLSVGAVADPEKIQILESLKKRLPEGVTFWLNRYEGFKRHYTKDEIESFSTMDLNLKNELARFKANAGACTAGRESLFVHSNGDISPCLMNERVIGNLYDSKPLKETICSLNVCRCYLCYACRKDLSLPYKDPFFRF
jgi:MoaA/NifB/PqqE/SkfB family radical SAM enzyme